MPSAAEVDAAIAARVTGGAGGLRFMDGMAYERLFMLSKVRGAHRQCACSTCLLARTLATAMGIAQVHTWAWPASSQAARGLQGRAPCPLAF